MSRQTAKNINNDVLVEEAKYYSIKELAGMYDVNYTTIFKRLHSSSEYQPKKGRPKKIRVF